MPNSMTEGIVCLVDTDIIIDFLRHKEYALNLFEHWSNTGLMAISTLTYLEIYHGIRTGEEESTNTFLSSLTPISIDVAIARQAGKILGRLQAKGLTIGIADAIIASSALFLNVPLLTNNVEHYTLDGLRLVPGRRL